MRRGRASVDRMFGIARWCWVLVLAVPALLAVVHPIAVAAYAEPPGLTVNAGSVLTGSRGDVDLIVMDQPQQTHPVLGGRLIDTPVVRNDPAISARWRVDGAPAPPAWSPYFLAGRVHEVGTQLGATTYGYGWPMVSLCADEASVVSDFNLPHEPREWVNGVETSWVNVLPTRVVWSGLAINVLALGGFVYPLVGAFLVWRARVRRRRRARGACAACGYPLEGRAVCTECGAERPVRARSAPPASAAQ